GHGEFRGGRALARRRAFRRPCRDAAGDLCVARRMGGEQLPPRAPGAHQAALVQAPQEPGLSMADREKEAFLARWSRLKQEKPPEQKAEKPAPVLPSVDKLTPESDFQDFMHPKVEDALRRLALKKLFSDPHFNI